MSSPMTLIDAKIRAAKPNKKALEGFLTAAALPLSQKDAQSWTTFNQRDIRAAAREPASERAVKTRNAIGA